MKFTKNAKESICGIVDQILSSLKWNTMTSDLASETSCKFCMFVTEEACYSLLPKTKKTEGCLSVEAFTDEIKMIICSLVCNALTTVTHFQYCVTITKCKIARNCDVELEGSVSKVIMPVAHRIGDKHSFRTMLYSNNL